MTIQQIRDQIANAKVDRALKALIQLPAVKADEDYESLVTLLTGQHKSNERGRMQGFLSNDNYMVERNRINHAILSLLSELEEDADPLTPVNDVPAHPDPLVIDPVQPEIISADGPLPGQVDTKILFLASNPSDTAKLQLTKEHSRISEKLQNADHPERFPIRSYRAVTPSQFTEHIFEQQPDIVHFSGHGDKSSPEVQNLVSRGMGRSDAGADDSAEESGIFLQDEDGRNAHFVTTAFLENTFDMMVNIHEIPIKVVLFNACHSSVQAAAISKVVPYVIGTSWSVKDDAAIAFASGFYFGITKNMSIDKAVRYGVNSALAYGEPKDRFLLYKDGKKVEW